MVVRCLCSKYNRAVAKNHKAVQCDICDKWVHIACKNLNKNTYKYSKKMNLLGIVFVVFKRDNHIAQLAMMF